jgi:hypothetical protein
VSRKVTTSVPVAGSTVAAGWNWGRPLMPLLSEKPSPARRNGLPAESSSLTTWPKPKVCQNRPPLSEYAREMSVLSAGVPVNAGRLT